MSYAAQIEAAKNELSHYRSSPFRQYQKEAIEYVLESDKKFIFLEAPTGCIAEGTIINLNRGRLGRPTTIEKAVKHFNQKGSSNYNWDLSIPTYIRSLKNDFVQLSLADNFLYSGKKSVMKLLLADGTTLRATPDHKIMTTCGYKRMDELSPEHQVCCDTLNAQKSLSKKKKNCDTPVCNLWFHPFAHIVKTCKDARGYTKRVEIHRAIYEAYINNLSLKDYKYILRHDLSRSCQLKFVDPSLFHIHHKDGNHYNNEIENLEKLTISEHLKLHAANGIGQKNFNQGIVRNVNVVSVTDDGFAETYDISVPETNNFIANGIIVHNSGKSIIGVISAMCKNGANYSVHSKTLQHQITRDFPEAKSLFGRSNYECTHNPALTCAECFHTKDLPCEHKKESCLYEIQKAKVLTSRLRILNYDYLLSECNYIGKFSVLKDPSKNFNVLDEADSVENTLINFVTLTFTSYGLSRLGLKNEIEELKHTSKDKEKLLSSWKLFAELAMERAQEIKKGLDIRVSNFRPPLTHDNIRTLKDRTSIIRMMEKIKLFIESVDETWLYDDSQEDRYVFRPLWLNEEIANQFMWRHSNKWLLMSASFLPIHIECKRLGIPLDETDYKVLPSTFPVSRRPIHIEETANLTGKTMAEETPKLIARIDEIIKSKPTEKGLIHAVSFKLANEIYRGIDSDRLIIHDSANRQDKLEFFMESKDPLVLISPSMERGVSLSMDLCRFIIIAKAPFLYLGDKIVAARVYSSKLGSEWYAATMLTTVLQMTGRGMRSKDDYCETYILDAQFNRVYLQKPSYLPEWWKQGVVWE